MEQWLAIQQQLKNCNIVLKLLKNQINVIFDSASIFPEKEYPLSKMKEIKSILPYDFIEIPSKIDQEEYIFICNKISKISTLINVEQGIKYHLNKNHVFETLEGQISNLKHIDFKQLISQKHHSIYRILSSYNQMNCIQQINPNKPSKNIISYKQKNKEYFIEDHCYPIKNDQDEIDHYEGYIHDITHIMKIQKELKLQKNKLKLILKHSSIGIWEWNLDEKSFNIDDNAQKVLGLKNKSFKGGLIELAPILHPTERFAFKEEVLQFLRTQNTHFEKETKVYKKDKVQWVLIRGVVLERNALGNPIKVLGSVIDLNQNKLMEQEIMQTIVSAQEEERKRFATDLHDGLGQYLAAIKMNFDALNVAGTDKVRINKTIKDLLNKTIKDLRAVSHNLMPGSVSDLGLIMAIREIQNLTNNSYQIQFDFDCNMEEVHLKENVAINIYRIVQELVNNTIKHSGADHILLNIKIKDQGLWLQYKDNGIGIKKSNDSTDGIGMKNLKTRVFSTGGVMNITTPISGGFQFNAFFPA